MFDLCNKIARAESIKDFDVFIRDYETFEEIPLISRLRRLSSLKAAIGSDGIQDFLINFAFFYMNNIVIHAAKQLRADELSGFFVCLTFPRLDNIDEFGCCIPNFLVTRKAHLFEFLKNVESNEVISEYPLLKSSFERIGIISSFRFAKTVVCDDMFRLYAIPNKFWEMLGLF